MQTTTNTITSGDRTKIVTTTTGTIATADLAQAIEQLAKVKIHGRKATLEVNASRLSLTGDVLEIEIVEESVR